LRAEASGLQLDGLVEFHVNVQFDLLKNWLSTATVGLHTMWNEHFGISVVECMAAGTLMLAHDSGGPQQDIVVEYDGHRTGYLAHDELTYSQALRTIFSLTEQQRLDVRTNARKSVRRFADDEFEKKFVEVTRCLFC